MDDTAITQLPIGRLTDEDKDDSSDSDCQQSGDLFSGSESVRLTQSQVIDSSPDITPPKYNHGAGSSQKVTPATREAGNRPNRAVNDHKKSGNPNPLPTKAAGKAATANKTSNSTKPGTTRQQSSQQGKGQPKK